jgi:hypothetical protein
MTWFRTFPWLTLSILLIVYGVFGFVVGEQGPKWGRWLMEQGQIWGWSLKEEIAVKLLLGLVATLVLGFTLLLAIPMALTKIFVGNSLKSDNQAILTFLVWSLAAVFFFRWFGYFLQILILVSSTILARLDLQRSGLKEWQIFGVLVLICLGGFELGMLTFSYYHSPTEAHVG